MYSLFFKLLHFLNKGTSVGFRCKGDLAPLCRETFFYRWCMRLLVRIECLLLARTEYLAPEKMTRIQLRRVQGVIRGALTTPYWKERLDRTASHAHNIRSIQEMARFPIVSREDVQKNFVARKMVNPAIPLRRHVTARTSGSTGEPLTFFLDTIVVAGRRARYYRMVRWFSAEKTPLVIRALPTRPLGFTRNIRGIRYFQLRSMRNISIPLNRFRLFLRRLYRRSSAYFLIDMFPSNAARFVEMLRQTKIDTSRILGFVCGGEALLPGEREYVKKTLARDIRSYYASTEFEIIGQECGQSPEHAFHINAEYFYIEIVDKKGNPLPRGMTGRVIITSLENEVMPFLRYDTGDLGRILEETCPCGRTLPLLIVEGRQANLIRLPNGRSFTQFNVIGHFYNPEVVSQIRQFQVVHERPDAFTIKLVPQSTTDEQQERAIEILKDRLLETFGEDTHVSFEIIDEIPVTERGKRIGYVSNF